MENWIEHIPEPERLLLAWQAPDETGNRFRWVVAVLERHGTNIRFRYLTDPSEFRALNDGHEMSEPEELGYRGYPAFSMNRSHDGAVLETFMRRLPPRNRSDFSEYLSQFRLRPDVSFSDFALLGLTGAKLPSDWFSLVDPLDPKVEVCERLIEVAGHRYILPDSPLRPGDAVEFVPEPENPHDTNAVAIHAGDQKIGYVNRLQASTFRQWLANREVTGSVERINGNSQRPLVFCFVRVRPLRAKAAA